MGLHRRGRSPTRPPARSTLAPGDTATCTITNTDQPAKLTLAKVVDPAASGSGKVPADWTLTATPVGDHRAGPGVGQRRSDDAGGVNAVTVFSGSYDLSESGPAGFTPGTWVCQGGVVTGARVVVPPGGAVQCTITNTAVTPTLTLVKVVDNGTTGATTPATAWTPLGGRPDADQRPTGAAAVTAAPVQVGHLHAQPSRARPATRPRPGCARAAPPRRRRSVTLSRGPVGDVHDHEHRRRARS